MQAKFKGETKFLCCWALLVTNVVVSGAKIGDDVEVELVGTENGIAISAKRGDLLILNGTLLSGRDLRASNCITIPLSCQMDDLSLTIDATEEDLHILWETQDLESSFTDCYDFLEDTNWYGGPEYSIQKWPLEKLEIDGTKPYVVRRDSNSGVVERYWLNSKGVYIYLDEKVPLWVEQNVNVEGKVCFTANAVSPYINRTRNFLDYRVVFKGDPKEAHLHAINTYLGKPTGHPNEKMIREPIWTTWAKYKRDITDDIVLEFANAIRDQGYKNGQLEIDDNWETCYGAQEFSQQSFPDIENTVSALKEMDFRVTLWVHPFVNHGCENNSMTGMENGYYVLDAEGNMLGSWWDGDQAHQIDFTNPEAAEWFSARLRKLQENPKIDSFKFDAGEIDYAPQPAVYRTVDQETIPNVLTSSYIRTVAEFGDLIEVRSAWRTQDLPVFIRMLDKDSTWTEYNGLYTLVTTLLQLNMNGYTMVLPDMIGGNGYSSAFPSAELLVRWTQANTFMPTMQFSFLPWEITSEEFDAGAIVKKFVDLHENVSSLILDAMEDCIKDGTPVNPPIWWIDPTDTGALLCDDEFLLGDKVLVAPILNEGATSRNVYLPKGRWTDGNTGEVYDGPIIINDFPAPIEILPYFYRDTTK